MRDNIQITDDELRYLILGMFRGLPMMDEFPIKMRRVVDNFDDQGTIQSFTIVTESGLKYTTHVTFDGQE